VALTRALQQTRATFRPTLPITNQTFRDGVPHETKAYAIAKPAHHPVILKQKQSLEKSVPNLRSQEVSREMAVKSADMTFVG
jgi:hypothetical protein